MLRKVGRQRTDGDRATETQRPGDVEQERGTGEGKEKTEANRQMDRLDSASVSSLFPLNKFIAMSHLEMGGANQLCSI